jgi:hypothetical protein
MGGQAVAANQQRIAGERAATKAEDKQNALIAEQKKRETDQATLVQKSEEQQNARARQREIYGAKAGREGTMISDQASVAASTSTGAGGSGKTLLGA